MRTRIRGREAPSHLMHGVLRDKVHIVRGVSFDSMTGVSKPRNLFFSTFRILAHELHTGDTRFSDTSSAYKTWRMGVAHPPARSQKAMAII